MSGPASVVIKTVPTPHGLVSVTISTPPRSSVPPPSSSRPGGLTLLLLHGNSSSSRVFRHILSGPAPPGVARVVAMDYLGHGLSQDAAANAASSNEDDHSEGRTKSSINNQASLSLSPPSSPPEVAYTQRGYAESAVAVLEALDGVRDFVVLGWSLGGHVAIELLALLEEQQDKHAVRCRGVMITGTPPANGAEQCARGFDVTGTGQVPATRDKEVWEEGEERHMPAATETWPELWFEHYPFWSHGRPHERWMVDAARRTDGRARRVMFDAFRAGTGVDQCRVLETSGVPCAVVNGAAEACVNLDYVDQVKYGNLWEGKCHRIPSFGHTPFWERPDLFQEYLVRFCRDVAQAG